MMLQVLSKIVDKYKDDYPKISGLKVPNYSNSYSTVAKESIVRFDYRPCFGNLRYIYKSFDCVIMHIQKKELISDIDFIKKYIEKLNEQNLFYKIEFIEERENEIDIKIYNEKDLNYFTKLLSTLTAIRYLYESHAGDKRSIPILLLYLLDNYKNLSFLQCLYLAHFNSLYAFNNNGHSLYSAFKKKPEFDIEKIRENMSVKDSVTESFESGDTIINLLFYNNKKELEEIIKNKF